MFRITDRSWSRIFWSAAAFNFVFGLPLFLAPGWSIRLAFVEVDPSRLAENLWSDFGFCVLLVGVGYGMVARQVDRNRGIVWLGVFAKLFDVITLGSRAASGVAQPIVLIPAAIDAAYVCVFLLFLYQTRGIASAAD